MNVNLTSTTAIVSPLARRAALVSVVISQWEAHKLDKRVTDEINNAKRASKDAGRYNKLLIEKKRLADIKSLVGEARRVHHTMTKPWCDDGLRILPNALHQEFTDKIRVLKRAFHDAVEVFCRDYPQYIAERQLALRDMFNAGDYPNSNEIRSKFSMEIKTFPVPESNDFRSDVLDQATIDDIRREIDETNKQVLGNAMKDTVEQITKLVGHMSERFKAYSVGNEDGTRSFFTDSTVENVRQLAELLPAFNFTNDPAFEHVAQRIKQELCAEDAKDLRTNTNARLSIAKSADDILKDVSGLLG